MKMALSSFVRRASSSIIPLSIRSRRSDHRQISLFNIENRFSGGGQFLPFVRFSTVPEETPGNSPVHCFVRRVSSPSIVRSLGSRRPYQTQCVQFSTVTNDNIFSLIESNVIRTPDADPVRIEDDIESLCLVVKKGKHQRIELDVSTDTYEVSDGNPKFSMTARINAGGGVTEFETTVEPHRISIYSLKKSQPAIDHHFEEYLGTKGINDGMIESLLNYFMK